MTAVTVSASYRVTIPKDIREALAIRPGQRLEVFQYGGRIELVPVPEPSEARGSLIGIDTTIQREPDRL